MNNRPQANQLLTLRSKTDRQLVALIASRLDFGIYCARLAAGPETKVRWSSTEADQAAAVKAFDEACAWLPWAAGASRLETERLQAKLEVLRQLLAQSTIHAEMRIQTACS